MPLRRARRRTGNGPNLHRDSSEAAPSGAASNLYGEFRVSLGKPARCASGEPPLQPAFQARVVAAWPSGPLTALRKACHHRQPDGPVGAVAVHWGWRAWSTGVGSAAIRRRTGWAITGSAIGITPAP